jgi:uncharacterized protein YqjF (DUF2071 family)
METPIFPWVMQQRWEQLLFAHWPIPVPDLRPLISPSLEIDTYAGQAWIAVVPFAMRGIHFRGLPGIPTMRNFLELNVRTYVRWRGEMGVWFFSLDANSGLAVEGARLGFHLPYRHAEMLRTTSYDKVQYRSTRRHAGFPAAALAVQYRPTGPVFQAAPGSLEHFLTERYCLFAASRGGKLYRAQIAHVPWPLQVAEASFEANTMVQAAGLHPPDTAPLLHYAEALSVKSGWREAVD